MYIICDIDLLQKCRSGQTVSEQKQNPSTEHNRAVQQDRATEQASRSSPSSSESSRAESSRAFSGQHHFTSQALNPQLSKSIRLPSTSSDSDTQHRAFQKGLVSHKALLSIDTAMVLRTLKNKDRSTVHPIKSSKC